jgi:alkyldihydroxyacetonephosphate synthase
MWLDYGEPLATPDYIVPPGSAEEISEIWEVANNYRIPVIPWDGGSRSQGVLPVFAPHQFHTLVLAFSTDARDMSFF